MVQIVHVVIDDSSDKTITGIWEFDRSLGGTLIIPSGSAYPSSPQAGEIFWHTDLVGLYRRSDDNTTWVPVSGSGGGSGGGDPGAQYLVLANTASLSNERAFTPGTGLLGTDAGANSTYTLAINNNVVATTSGSTFTGPVNFSSSASFSMGMSGSVTQLTDGRSFIVAGSNITVTSQSNGQVVISSTASGGSGDTGASYVVLSATSSLANERVLTAGSGITITDGGAGGAITIATTAAALPSGYFTASFTQSNLVSSVLHLTHSVGVKYVGVSLYDGNDFQIVPDEVVLDTTSSLRVDLTSFAPIPGTWHVVVSAGAAPRPIAVNVTGSYTAEAENVLLCSTSGGGYTVTLPNASSNVNSKITVKKVSSDVNVLTVGTTASQTIDGQTTKSIAQQWTAVTFIAYDSSWYIM